MLCIDRPHGMNDMRGRQIKTGSNTGFSGRTTHARGHLRHPAAGLEKPRPGGAMNRPVDPPAAQHPFVGRVDDRVHLLSHQIPDQDADSSTGREPGLVHAQSTSRR